MPPMGFLYPGALIFFALIPLLLIAYLVRERPRSVIVSSVLGYRALRALKSERPWGWPRLDWLFLMELLILSLAVLAIAEPYVIHQRTPVAVVLDNSAAMQAGIPAGARFEAARHTLARAIPDQSGVTVTLYTTAPQPHKVAGPISVAQARRALDRIEPVDAPQSAVSVAKLLGDIISGHRFTQCLFATADPVSQPLPPGLHVVQGRRAAAQFCDRLVRGGRRRIRLGRAQGAAHGRQLQLSAAKPGGRDCSRRQDCWPGPRRALEPREIGAVDFPTLAPSAVYRADLKPADAFALDNVAYATPPSGAQIQVLFVSPTPADAAGTVGAAATQGPYPGA